MARKIEKIDTFSRRVAYGKPALCLSLPFLAVGGYFALAGFGALPLPGKLHAPRAGIGFFGVAFALAGLMLLVASVRGLRLRRRAERMRLLHENEPWVADYDWDPEGASDRALGRWVYPLFGLAFLALFLVPFHWWAFFSRQGPWPVKIITGIFDLILVLAACTVLYRLAQYLKFGTSRLRFARFPFHPGERLQVVFAPNRFEVLDLTLRYVEERFESRGSGRNRSVQLVCYEHERIEQRLEAAPGCAEVEITFDLPDDPALVDSLGGPPLRYWELVIEASLPGVDFRTSFPLPVYAARRPVSETCPV